MYRAPKWNKISRKSDENQPKIAPEGRQITRFEAEPPLYFLPDRFDVHVCQILLLASPDHLPGAHTIDRMSEGSPLLLLDWLLAGCWLGRLAVDASYIVDLLLDIRPVERPWFCVFLPSVHLQLCAGRGCGKLRQGVPCCQ